MTRRRPAAEPVDSKHLRDLENEMRKAWAQRQGPRGPQPDDRTAEDAAVQPTLTTSEHETAL